MVSVKDLIEKIKSTIRGIMYEVAKLLDALTGGFIRPWHVTLLSLAGHILIMLALAEGLFGNSAILLIGFGLMDALDGAVAKFQGRASLNGMLLDSTTDRLKEMLIFAGLAFYFADSGDPVGALYSVLALGFSFSVSYVRAKGEAAMLEHKLTRKKSDFNREFEDGIFGYEVRMAILVVALAFGEPLYGVLAVAAGALTTFIRRFGSVSKRLNDQD